MPITANSFILVNATSENIAQLDAALAYLQAHSPDVARPILEAAAENQVRIVFSDPVVNVHDGYGEPQHAIIWNPAEGLVVHDAQGNQLGVQSPANGLFHEIVHSIDPQQVAQSLQPNSQYGNHAEAAAVIYSDLVAQQCGEITRDNYEGDDIIVANVTAHTGDDGSGQQVWKQTNGSSQEEVGPAYLPGQPAPAFGYPGNEHDNDPGNYAGNEHDNDPSNDPGNYAGNEHDNDPGNDPGNYAGNEHDYDPGNYPGNEHDYDPGIYPGNEHDYDPGIYPGNEHDYDPVPDVGGGWGDWGDWGGGGGGGGGCVAVASLLPDGRVAGHIRVGDSMELGDQDTLAPGRGIVSHSQAKTAPGYRVTTASGASLVCSETAPIPVFGKGLLTPDKLVGERVAVRHDESGLSAASWERVTRVEHVGMIEVQHITVGDRCFWAGEKRGAYILHHNMKDTGGGFWPDWPWGWDPIRSETDAARPAAGPGPQPAEAVLLTGVPPALVDGHGLA